MKFCNIALAFVTELKHKFLCSRKKSRSVVTPRGPVSAPFLRPRGGLLYLQMCHDTVAWAIVLQTYSSANPGEAVLFSQKPQQVRIELHRIHLQAQTSGNQMPCSRDRLESHSSTLNFPLAPGDTSGFSPRKMPTPACE